MTEDVPRFLRPGEIDDRAQAPTLERSPGWHLSDDDLSVIDGLHAICAEWLSFAKTPKSACVIAAALEAFEAIAAGRPVASNIQIEVARKPKAKMACPWSCRSRPMQLSFHRPSGSGCRPNRGTTTPTPCGPSFRNGAGSIMMLLTTGSTFADLPPMATRPNC